MDNSINFSARVGRMLREERNKQGLSQEDVAQMVGIKRARLAKIELGSYSTGINQIGQIAKALGLDVQLIKETRI